jgi:hypothetical protein
MTTGKQACGEIFSEIFSEVVFYFVASVWAFRTKKNPSYYLGKLYDVLSTFISISFGTKVVLK